MKYFNYHYKCNNKNKGSRNGEPFQKIINLLFSLNTNNISAIKYLKPWALN